MNERAVPVTAPPADEPRRGARMDLTAAVSGMQQAKVMGEVQARVARKILDNQEMNGAAALKLLEAAGGGVARAGDALAAAATGLGGEIDAYA